MKAKLYFIIALAIFILGISLGADAQCAMCKATAESATDNIDQSIGEGLNSGILYLMGIPYVLMLFTVLVFFRKPLVKFYKELSHH